VTLTATEFVQNFFVPGEPLVLELRGQNDLLQPKVKVQILAEGDAPRIDPDRNWWITVCAHRRPSKGSTNSRTAAAATAVWADLDHMAPEEAERRRALAGLPTPSIAVNSGNGVHFYWLLKEPYRLADKNSKESFVDLLKRVALVLGGDLKVADIARILRVPGTFNVKDPQNPKLCSIVSTSRSRFAFEDLRAAVEALSVLCALFRPPRRHALALALPGWFRHNGGDLERTRALFHRLYEVTGDLAPTESGLDAPTEDAIQRAYDLPEDAVAFHPHLDAAFQDCPWLKNYLLEVLRAAKKRVVAERKEAAKETRRTIGGRPTRVDKQGNVFEMTPRLHLPDKLAIEIIQDGQPRFLIQNGTSMTVEKNILLAPGHYAEPYSDGFLASGAVFLPDGVEPYGTVRELYEGVRAFVHKWVDVPEFEEKWLPILVLNAYLYEKAYNQPIITPRGPPSSGKTRLGQVLVTIMPNGIRGSATMSFASIFHTANDWMGAIFLNEADFKRSKDNTPESEDITKFLIERYSHDGIVVRMNRDTGEKLVFNAYGPTIATTRQPFHDDAVEDRAFLVQMTETARSDIPLNLTAGFYAEAAVLRRKLWRFYFDHIRTFEIDETVLFPGVGTRINQLLQPVASLCKAVDPSFYTELGDFALRLAGDRAEARATSMDGEIIRAWFYLRHVGGEKHCSTGNVLEYIKTNFDPKSYATPQSVGRRAKSLGFKQKSTGRERYWTLTEHQHALFSEKYLMPEDRELVGALAKQSALPSSAADAMQLASEPETEHLVVLPRVVRILQALAPGEDMTLPQILDALRKAVGPERAPQVARETVERLLNYGVERGVFAIPSNGRWRAA